MGPQDRDYFMLRARQERLAAAESSYGAVRNRHEELASLYEMRVLYIDRGLFGDDSTAEALEAAPVPHIIIPAQ